MRKTKKIVMASLLAALSVGTLALTACDGEFTPLDGIPQGEVVSNGGFVVEKGDYVYFINGVETYTSDNTYGNVVKGALMRSKKADILAGDAEAETVVPSLMVAADYTSGIYIYGERVYYATPNNVRNTEGMIEYDYLDFKSARLDGSDVQSYFRVADNATAYRFVQAGADDAVYVLYADESDLRSYNTETGDDTLLAMNTTSYVFNAANVEDPVVYYTMNVTDDIDTDNPNQLKYTQVYRVSADATEAPYEYTFRQEYLDEHDGEAPYVNLGTLVLDGVGVNGIDEKGNATQFTQDLAEGVQPLTPNGYTYTLQSYENDGLYFTRTEVTSTSTTGEDGWLYYLAAAELDADWNSVTGNAAEHLDVVAQNTENTASNAVFYIDERGGHHYLYVKDAVINRADVGENGVATVQRIARNVSGATLMFLDDTSDPDYGYVYFNRTSGSGLSVERAVYTGSAADYSNLERDPNYQPVKLLDVQHASSWYEYEVIDGVVYYADTDSSYANSLNYISAVNLNSENGLMTNGEIEELTELYEEVVDYINEISDDNVTLSTALTVYFYSGSTQYFKDNIDFAVENGKEEDYLYDEETQKAFYAFADEGKEGDEELSFKDHRTRSSFITQLGKFSEADQEAYDTYWTNKLEHYTVAETGSGLPGWAWALIGVGIALVVTAAVLIPVFVIRAKKKKAAQQPKKQLLAVDTTDDRSVDVYATEEPEPAEPEEPAEEPEVPAEDLADAEAEPVDDLPAEESEQPAEEPAEDAAEDPEQN